MKLYHVTTSELAAQILKGGFRDGHADGVAGVWLSDVPLWDGGEIDLAAPPDGWAVLAVQLADELAQAHEVTIDDAAATYREWCVPAKVLNKEGTTTRAG